MGTSIRNFGSHVNIVIYIYWDVNLHLEYYYLEAVHATSLHPPPFSSFEYGSTPSQLFISLKVLVFPLLSFSPNLRNPSIICPFFRETVLGSLFIFPQSIPHLSHSLWPAHSLLCSYRCFLPVAIRLPLVLCLQTDNTQIFIDNVASSN